MFFTDWIAERAAGPLTTKRKLHEKECRRRVEKDAASRARQAISVALVQESEWDKALARGKKTPAEP